MSESKIIEAIKLICEAEEALEKRVEGIDKRLETLEKVNVVQANEIYELQKSVESLRDSAIRGEIASGRRTKDVAEEFSLTSSRVSQIAPRSNYKH